jgi:hypothetical protein
MFCTPSVYSVARMHHNDAFSVSGAPVSGDECIEGYARGEGDVSVDPRFTGAGKGPPWALHPDSPLIDQGDNRATGNLRRDIRGAPRIVEGRHGPVVDMGAFEYVPEPGLARH